MRINISESEQFIFRVAGLFLRDQSVLLHRAEHDDIWALPGGACEFHEDTKSALIREALEELNAQIEVKSLAFAVENFFVWNGRKAHEVGFYYRAEFTGEAEKFYKVDNFEGIEDKMEGVAKQKLYFKWVPVQSLGDYKVKPDFLKDKLIGLSSKDTVHIVNRDL